MTEYPVDRPVVGHFAGDRGEEVVVRRCAGDAIELHCHGGYATVAMIEEALIAAGGQRVAWSQWVVTRESDPITATALMALADARTERTAAILLDQYHGALGRALEEIRQSIDAAQPAPGTGPFFGERTHGADKPLAENMDLSPSAARQIDTLLERADLGRHLVKPWSVVLAGRVNVGKSSLINALAGYGRSIVHDAPGTTRDAVTAATAIDGWPVELCDTAGLRQGGDAVERAGIQRAQERLVQADLAILIFDRSAAWSADDQALVDRWPAALVVHNKCDLAPAARRPAGRAADECVARRRHRGVVAGDRPAAGAPAAAARRGRALYGRASGDDPSHG